MNVVSVFSDKNLRNFTIHETFKLHLKRPVPLADLCDEDRMLRGRNAAAALSGTISLFGKPGQSLAPLIGHFLLHDNQSKENVVKVMYLVPITLGVLQCLLWSQFNLTKTRDRRFL